MKFISALLCGVVSFCLATSASPNVIVFVTDDMHWSAHMDEGPITNKARRRVTIPTPNFDRVRQEGATFTRGVTAGTMCAPARFSILTGRYPSRSEYGQARVSPTETHLEVTVPNSKLIGEDLTANVATSLQAAGYTTGMAGKWHIAAGLARQSSYDDVVDAVESAGFDWAGGVYEGNVAIQNKLTAATYSHNMEWMVEEANSFTSNAMDKDQPFFLYFATTAPHAPSVEEALSIDPRQTPAGLLSRDPITTMPSRESVWERAVSTGAKKGKVDSTAGAIWCDDALGALMKNVEDRGELDNTMVILLMDHGQEGKGKIDEGGARILYAARYPATIFPHTVVDSVVSTVDIAPTVLELAGVGEAPYFVDGRSWLNLAEFSTSTPEDEPRNVFVENDYDRAIYGSGDDDNMKLVNGAELYDVSIGETTDLAELPAYSQVLQRLSTAFACYEDATAIGANGPVQCS